MVERRPGADRRVAGSKAKARVGAHHDVAQLVAGIGRWRPGRGCSRLGSAWRRRRPGRCWRWWRRLRWPTTAHGPRRWRRAAAPGRRSPRPARRWWRRFRSRPAVRPARRLRPGRGSEVVALDVRPAGVVRRGPCRWAGLRRRAEPGGAGARGGFTSVTVMVTSWRFRPDLDGERVGVLGLVVERRPGADLAGRGIEGEGR